MFFSQLNSKLFSFSRQLTSSEIVNIILKQCLCINLLLLTVQTVTHRLPTSRFYFSCFCFLQHALFLSFPSRRSLNRTWFTWPFRSHVEWATCLAGRLYTKTSPPGTACKWPWLARKAPFVFSWNYNCCNYNSSSSPTVLMTTCKWRLQTMPLLETCSPWITIAWAIMRTVPSAGWPSRACSTTTSPVQVTW